MAGASPAPTPAREAESNGSRVAIWIALGLAALTCLVFVRTLQFGFVSFDDPDYVYSNPVVSKGLTVSGFLWAFTHVHAANWHPLTSLSHMLDCQLYGLHASGHHLTNVLLHIATVVMLFLVLREMTGALWPCAFVAAVFAIHPFRVESVAWVSERKDVLSGLFFVLTLGAYVRYARHAWSPGRYLAVAALFALGLMSKPTLVTMPFLLLLLDFWPLRRFRLETPSGLPGRVILEKIPLLALSAASCVATVLAQRGAIDSLESISLSARITNAAVSYVAYVIQMFWPAGLVAVYPRLENGPPLWQAAGAALLLAAVTIGAVLQARKRPYLIVAWLWYLGMLVPMIGLMQVGMQSRADRYTYLSQIGLMIAVTWGFVELSAHWRNRQAILAVAAATVVAALSFVAWKQTAYWRDSITLWKHTLSCTSDNALAELGMGQALLEMGDLDAALPHDKEAARLLPEFADAQSNYALALSQKGRNDEAIAQYEKAIALDTANIDLRNDLAMLLFQTGKVNEAIDECTRALDQKPGFAEAHNTLAMCLDRAGKLDEAEAHYERALELKPDFPEAENNLADLAIRKGNLEAAMDHCRKALALRPGYADAYVNLAMALAKKGHADDAAAYCHKALELGSGSATVHNNAGNVLAEIGRMDDAIAEYQKAVTLKPGYAEAHYNLAIDLTGKGEVQAAVGHYEKALALQPGDIRILGNLAWLLATTPDATARNGPRAIDLAQKADVISGGANPAVLSTLAAAYAEAGRFPDAIDAAQRALGVVSDDQAGAIKAELALYQQGLPFHTAR